MKRGKRPRCEAVDTVKGHCLRLQHDSDRHTWSAIVEAKQDAHAMAQRVAAGKTGPKPPPCPTPRKKRFQREQDAIRGALGASRTYGKGMRVYGCVCGGWHITSRVRSVDSPRGPHRDGGQPSRTTA